METVKPIIAITMGDPCGIGPEVIVKAFASSVLHQHCRPVIIGNVVPMKLAASSFAHELSIRAIRKVSEADFKTDRLDVLGRHNQIDTSDLHYGKLHPTAAQTAFHAIQEAARLALRQEVDGIATAPIQKEGMQEIGFPFPGHTEFFADVARTGHYGMMMVGAGLKVMLASIHLPLKEAIAQLTAQDLFEKISLLAHTLQQDFGLDQPHIAVAGLNPHAGEGGLFGEEERKEVLPAVALAKKVGIDVSGPFAADTLFYKLKQGKFDAVLALYHDQALIPIKLLAFGEGVNVTVGLPFIRTSVDHGTAYDIAGMGLANAGSLIEAVKLAAEMAIRRYPRFAQ